MRMTTMFLATMLLTSGAAAHEFKVAPGTSSTRATESTKARTHEARLTSIA
jgi:hypothetical protein